MSFKHNILNFIYKNKILISSIYFNLCFSLLPVKKNKIVICSFDGCGYGCNAKYITEEIIKQKLPVEIVWLTKPQFMNKESFPPQIRLVNYYDLNKCLYELATAKIWIDNVKKSHFINKGLKKKTTQFYLNTWHGSLGIKRLSWSVDNFAKNKKWSYVAKKNSDMTDLMISNCAFETDVYRTSLLFNKEIVLTGHPRNDILVKESKDLVKKVKETVNISEDKKIALYIPSYRDNLRIDCFNLDYERLKKSLEVKTGNEWEILTKFHHQNLLKIKYLNNQMNYQHDISFYPDTQELLYTADIIISDYSSCMFDFMLTRKPCFIYATDIEQYNNERGFYFPLESTPFPIARNNDEMEQNIKNFDNKKYIENVENFLASRNVLEDGNASKRVVEILKKVLNND